MAFAYIIFLFLDYSYYIKGETMKKNAITLALFTLLSLTAQAEEAIELGEVKVNAQGELADSILNNANNISDQVVDRSQ